MNRKLLFAGKRQVKTGGYEQRIKPGEFNINRNLQIDILFTCFAVLPDPESVRLRNERPINLAGAGLQAIELKLELEYAAI